MIDAAKLRNQLAASIYELPWIVYPPADRMGGGIGAHGTKYNIGGFEQPEDDVLAVAAVNALPVLLAVYEAACAWRDEGALLTRDREAADRLIEAIDTARSSL